MRARQAVAVVVGLGFLGAVWALALHVDSARLLTHTVGVFALLAELLRQGVLYPHEPTADLVYSVFYHPLAFAPYALLPGSGIDLFAGMRVLVGVETLLCLLLVAGLAGRRLGAARGTPALWCLCTLPVCFALIGMRDDPRAAVFALLALLAFGSEPGGRARPLLAAALLTLAFFVKATAPLAPGAALLWATWREAPAGAGGRARATALLLGACLAFVAAGVVFLQVGLDCNFLGNGLAYMLPPAREPRAWGEAVSVLARDLCGWYGAGAQPLDLALPTLLLASGVLLARRVLRRRADRYDVLVVAVWLKTVVTYRSHGTDLNHLLDLALFASVHVARGLASWLDGPRALCTVAIMLGLGQPWRRLIPEAATPALAHSPLANAAAGLRSQPLASTLCEEPFLAWLTQSRPLLTDPFLTFAALRSFPEIRARWFGPADHPAAVQRLVLMHNPFSDSPHVEHWYRHLHFDADFMAMVRRDWRAVLVTDSATVLVRKP